MSRATAEAAVACVARLAGETAAVVLESPFRAESYGPLLSDLRQALGRRVRALYHWDGRPLTAADTALLLEYGVELMLRGDHGRKALPVALQSSRQYSLCAPGNASAAEATFARMEEPYGLCGIGLYAGRDIPPWAMEAVLNASYAAYRANPAHARVTALDAMAKSCLTGQGGLCTFTDCLGTVCAIGPTGDLYLCGRFLGQGEYRLGTVGDSAETLISSPAYQALQSVQEGAKVACHGCDCFPLCRGGCLYRRLKAPEGKDPYCPAFQGMFRRLTDDLAAESVEHTAPAPPPTPALSMAGAAPHPWDQQRNRAAIVRAYRAGQGAGLQPLQSQLLEHPARFRNKLYLHVTFRCPLRCTHCYARGGERAMPDLPAAAALRALEEARNLGFAAGVITGGEPLAHPAWDEIAGRLAGFDRKGMGLVLRTSLGFPVPEERLLALCAAFPEIVVSIDGDRACHDARRGPGAYDQAVENLRRIKALGEISRISLCATLPREQREGPEGRAVEALCGALGIGRLRFRPVLPLGRGESVTREDAPPCQLAGEAEFTPRLSCGLGQNLYVEPDGACYPCYAWCGPGHCLGHVADGLDSVVNGEAFRALARHGVDTNRQCRRCPARYLCGGMCKAWVPDKEDIDAGGFDCAGRKEALLALAHRAAGERTVEP